MDADGESAEVLPDSIDILQMDRIDRSQAVRITHAYSKYRRFMTGGRLVKN